MFKLEWVNTTSGEYGSENFIVELNCYLSGVTDDKYNCQYYSKSHQNALGEIMFMIYIPLSYELQRKVLGKLYIDPS